MEITVTELEDAINYWRSIRPASGEERALSPEVDTLAAVYAMMIFHHLRSVRLDEVDDKAGQLLGAWRARRA